MIDIDLTGFIKIKLRPKDGGEPVEKEVDLFSFYNRLVDAGKDYGQAGDHAQAGEARAEFLKSEGFDVGATVATLLVDRLGAEVAAVQKKILSADSAETPEPTASPSGSSTD